MHVCFRFQERRQGKSHDQNSAPNEMQMGKHSCSGFHSDLCVMYNCASAFISGICMKNGTSTTACAKSKPVSGPVAQAVIQNG